jgi:hypothetical protein
VRTCRGRRQEGEDGAGGEGRERRRYAGGMGGREEGRAGKDKQCVISTKKIGDYRER